MVARIHVSDEVVPGFATLPACVLGYVVAADPQNLGAEKRAIAWKGSLDPVQHHHIDGLAAHLAREKITQRDPRTVNARAYVSAIPSTLIQVFAFTPPAEAGAIAPITIATEASIMISRRVFIRSSHSHFCS
jgi:hypothetical protein